MVITTNTWIHVKQNILIDAYIIFTCNSSQWKDALRQMLALDKTTDNRVTFYSWSNDNPSINIVVMSLYHMENLTTDAYCNYIY